MLLRQAVNITHILLFLLFNIGIRNTLRFKSKYYLSFFLLSKMILFLVCANPFTATVTGAMLLYIDIQSIATRKSKDASTLSTLYVTFDLYINNVPFKYSLFFCRRYVTQTVIIWNIQALQNLLYLFSWCCRLSVTNKASKKIFENNSCAHASRICKLL
jgi:hypothetical protein